MKQLVAGLVFFLAGVLLCGINWLGAAAAVPAVSEWNGRRISGGWQYVGYTPLIFGIILVVVGLLLVIWSVISATKVAGQ